ncbi:MAG: DNA-protecting protein DprA [Bacteroidales bacterium]|nr:DNA-protecting protein DprA [Bacteroidales bacterium]
MNLKNILVLSMVKGIGPVFVKKNISQISKSESCEELVQAIKSDELNNIESYKAKADEIIFDCETNGIKIISILDNNYPKRLFEIADPPSVLFLKGNDKVMNNVVAVIGTRHSTELGNRIAERVGAYFSEKYSVCNGLVEGIDEHSVYSNGHVVNNAVGVISGGLMYNETCSIKHIKMIDAVLNAGGLIISEFHPRQKEDKFSGVKASRVQAGLSKGLILVQSSVSGGSKYTISTFSKLNRTMGVINFEASDEYINDDSFGANRLIAQKGIPGVAEFIGIKSVSSIRLKNVIPINTNNDYSTFEKSME